jgi:hypothetical protein
MSPLHKLHTRKNKKEAQANLKRLSNGLLRRVKQVYFDVSEKLALTVFRVIEFGSVGR